MGLRWSRHELKLQIYRLNNEIIHIIILITIIITLYYNI